MVVLQRYGLNLNSLYGALNYGCNAALAREGKRSWKGGLTSLGDAMSPGKNGVIPTAKALTAEQQYIQRLQTQVKQLELEKEILKKAAA